MCSRRLGPAAARSSDTDVGVVANNGIPRSRPSGSRMTISRGPRPERRSLTGKHLPNRGWWGSITRTRATRLSSVVASTNVRRCQDDRRASRSIDASLRHCRDGKRKLALQEPRLNRYGVHRDLHRWVHRNPPRARCVCLWWGTPRRAGPPCGLPAQAAPPGSFLHADMGPFCAPIDIMFSPMTFRMRVT